MTGPLNGKPGQAPIGRSAAEIEAEIRAEVARLAMEDDLGIARVEDLPLEDESKDRARGQNARHAEANSRRGQPLSRGPLRQPSLPGGNGAAWGMNQVWQDAMAAKIFDDDEAETVKNLDDLGGGRLYDNAAAAAGPQTARISHMTMRILNQRHARSGNQPSHNNNPTAANPSSHRGNNKPAKLKPKPTNVNPRTRQANQLRARPVTTSPAALPMQETIIDLNAPLSFEIENVVWKVVISFSSRDINPALPALILLSAAAPPELGFMTVVIYNSKYCEWPVSGWFDYSTGADNLLNVIFQNDGVQQGYGLQFENYNDLVKFMDTVRSLQTGKHPAQVGSASVPAPTVIRAPAPTVTRTPAPTVTRTPTPTVTRTPTPTVTRTPTPTVIATTASNTLRPEVTPKGSISDDICLRAASPQVPAPPNVPSASGTVLVPAAVSEPTTPPTTPDAGGAEDAPTQAFRSAAMVTCRTLFQFFHHTRAAATATVEDMEQTAAGIRSGILEHTMDTARSQGASEQQIQVLIDTINECFASQSAGQEVERAATNSRLVYSIDFLMSRRDAAVSPPSSMANIPYLPQPGSSSRGRVSSRGRAFSHQNTAFDRPQVLRSANAMQWVLNGELGPKMPNPVNDTAPGRAQAAAPRVAGLGDTPDTGLQNSRWASGAQAPKHANFFTGPRYEKAWSKRTYLEDLAQLDPQAEVTVGIEDMMDHYFPLPDASRAQPSPQASTVDGNRASTGSANTDRMDDLSVDMSRLSIQSPTATRRQSARLAASADATGYAARQYRELCTQPASTGSTPSVSQLEAQATPCPSTLTPRPASTVSTPSVSHLEAQATLRLSAMAPQFTPAVSAPSAAYLAAQTTPRPSTVTPTSTIPTPSVTQLETQFTSRFSTMAPRVTPTASSPSPISMAAQIPNTLRPAPTLARTEPSTPAEPPRSAPTQPPSAVPAQSPATTAAQPGIRGLAASRHSDGTAPSSSGKFDFYLPDSARR